MPTDKITNDQPVPATEGQPTAQQLVQRFIGGFGPSPEQGRAWREAAFKRRLERETAASPAANKSTNLELGANNSPATGGLGPRHPDDRASKA
jgi:hypothetical protein